MAAPGGRGGGEPLSPLPTDGVGGPVSPAQREQYADPSRAADATGVSDLQLQRHLSLGLPPREVTQTGDVHIAVEADTKMSRGVIFITPPDGGGQDGARIPTDLCCVIDVSGSMSCEAKVKDTTEITEKLSVLDLVRHAVRTVSETLTEQDTLSVVAYSETATMVLNKQKMDKPGKEYAAGQLARMQPQTRTNIWCGIEMALEGCCGKNLSPGRQSQIMLLTDGVPNMSPPRHPDHPDVYGEVHEVKKLRAKGYCTTIHTFGFGYQLETGLLVDLAEATGGAYSFIPESGMVGTVFINSIANILVTLAPIATVRLSGFRPEKRYSETDIQQAGTVDLPRVDAGPLLLGQRRAVRLPYLEEVTTLNVELEYICTPTGKKVKLPVAKYDLTQQIPLSIDAEAELCRFDACNALSGIIDCCKQRIPESSTNARIECVGRCQASPAVDTVLVKGIIEDLSGQVEEASRLTAPAGEQDSWFQKWGRHYLPSLRMGHRLQQNNNFKDPGVQNYGGKLFEKIQNDTEELFIALPPPTGTLRASQQRYAQQYGGAAPAAAPRAAPVTMAAYHNQGGG